VAFLTEPAVEPAAGFLERSFAVDEDAGGIDDVVLPSSARTFSTTACVRIRRELDVSQIVRFGTDGFGQPVVLVLELDHDLVDGNGIRRWAVVRLSPGVVHPGVHRRARPANTEYLVDSDSIRKR
jgi:hypothetical protein